MEKTSFLMLSALLLLKIPRSSANCRITHIVRGVSQYSCNSVQELEEQGTLEMLDVSIHDNKSDPITSLSASAFQKTPNLKRIVIKRAITGINVDAFQSLNDLSSVVINNNNFREVQKNVFSNLPLQLIDLSENAISNIEPGAFLNLTNLKSLRITKNNLRKICTGIFSNLPVELLSLSRNRISSLDLNAFANMKNLKRLHLDGNLLSNFHAKMVMNKAKELEILWLHNNSFTAVNRDTVKGLDNLRFLNLQDNRISRIFPYTFENVLNLETLVLSNNWLTSLEDEVFPEDGMPKLIKLYLNDNRFSYLSTKVMGSLRKLTHIRIGGNPWQCPCLDLILVWLGDYKIKQSCDKDYYNGIRPICILEETRPNTCVYSSNPSSYQRYTEINSKLPKSPLCAL